MLMFLDAVREASRRRHGKQKYPFNLIIVFLQEKKQKTEFFPEDKRSISAAK